MGHIFSDLISVSLYYLHSILNIFSPLGVWGIILLGGALILIILLLFDARKHKKRIKRRKSRGKQLLFPLNMSPTQGSVAGNDIAAEDTVKDASEEQSHREPEAVRAQLVKRLPTATALFSKKANTFMIGLKKLRILWYHDL